MNTPEYTLFIRHDRINIHSGTTDTLQTRIDTFPLSPSGVRAAKKKLRDMDHAVAMLKELLPHDH